MDIRAWNRVLSHWIRECNFIQKDNYFTIEQSSIDEFFENFTQRHLSALPEKGILEFLKVHYPLFDAKLTEENLLHPDDYVYAYSLLLHYSCVKVPDPWFQTICQKLSDKIQRYLEAFFKAILESQNIDKLALSEIIAEVAKSTNTFSPILNDSFCGNGSGGGGGNTINNSSFFSPAKSPNENNDSAVEQQIAMQSTPKTMLLEQRTRELQSLRAQLETELYEKSLLEIKIKENEQILQQCLNDRKRMSKELQALRLEATLEAEAQTEPKQEDADKQCVIIGRLRKEIEKNEEKIFELSTELESVRADLNLKEKTMNAMKMKIKEWENRVNDYDMTIRELEEELEKKELRIRSLTSDKQELTQYLDEMRATIGKPKFDFNSSFDCLNSSFTRHVNSSGSTSSPENLGVAVVDIQFQEMKQLNEQLNSRLDSLSHNNMELSVTVSRFERDIEELKADNRKYEQLLETKTLNEQVLREQYDKLRENHDASCQELRQSNDYVKTMQAELNSKRIELHKLGNEIASLKDRISKSDEKLLFTSNKFDELQNENSTLKDQLASSQLQLNELMKENENFERELKANRIKINSLNSLLQIASDVKGDLESDLDAITSTVNSMLLSHEASEKQIAILEEEKRALEKKIDEMQLESKEKDQLLEEIRVSLKNERLNYANEKCILETKYLNTERCLSERAQEVEENKEHIEELNKLTRELEDKLANVFNDLATSKTTAEEEKAMHEQEMKKILEEMASKANIIEQQQSDLDGTHAKAKQLEDELKGEKELRESRESALDELRQHLKELQKQLSDDAENGKRLLEEKLTLEKSLESADAAKSKLEEELHSLREAHKKKLTKLSSDLSNLMQKNEKYASNIQKFNNERTTIEVQLHEANGVLKQLSTQLETELKCKETLNARVIALEKQLQKYEEDLSVRTEEHNELKAEFAEQKEKLESAMEEITRLGNAKDKHLVQIDELTEELNTLKGEYMDFVCELEDAKKANDRLTEEKTEFVNNLVSTQAEKATIIDLLDKKAEELKRTAEENVSLKAENQIATQRIERNDRAVMELLIMLGEKRFIEENGKDHGTSSNEEQENCATSDTNDDGVNVKRLRNGLNQLLQSMSVLEVERKQLSNDRMRLSNELTLLRKQYSETEDCKQTSDLKQKQLNEELEIIREQAQHVEKINERLLNEIDGLREQITEKENDLKAKQVNIERLGDINKSLMREKESAEKYHQQIQALHQAEEKRLNSMLDSKGIELDAVRRSFNETMEKLNEKTNYLCDKLDSDLREARKECEKLKILLKDKEIELNEAQKTLEALKKEQSDSQSLCDDLQVQIVNQKKKHVILENEMAELNEKHRICLENLETSKKAFEEINTKLLDVQNHNSELEKSIETHEETRVKLEQQLREASGNVQRLTKENEVIKNEKNQLNNELKKLEQVHCEIVESNNLLKQQYNDYKANENVSESKIKDILERSQSLERDLLSIQNEKKLLQTNLEKSESQNEKLNDENRKLRESQVDSTKRIEMLAMKLGDIQASNAQLERECGKLQSMNKVQETQNESLVKSKEAALNEVKILKEHLSGLELKLSELREKIQYLNKENRELISKKENLETFERDAKLKISKYEKMREDFENKVFGLKGSLSKAEHDNVRLTLEIGALNSQIVQLKQAVSVEQKAQKEEESTQALITKKTSERCTVLEHELEEVQQDNIKLSDKLSKVSLSLQITEDKCKDLLHNADYLKNELSAMEKGKNELQHDFELTKSKLKDYENLHEKMLIEKRKIIEDLQLKLETMEKTLIKKDAEISMLKNQMESMRRDVQNSNQSNKNTSEALLADIEDLRMRLNESEAKLQKELNITLQLRQDNQVLYAKYQNAKESLETLEKDSENRIKQNRIEMEGKLEKMKDKMKALHNEGTEKLKKKHECEIVNYKSEMDRLRARNSEVENKYRKSLRDLKTLQENVSEIDKENKFLTGKLKHFEETSFTTTMRTSTLNNRKPAPQMSPLRRGTISQSTTSLPTSTSGVSTNMRSNGQWTMEDEEGEIFNNTYLADLKSGRMSMNQDIGPEELQYRNSLVPPHLKSCYPVQYFLNDVGEDELKDGPNSLDDSMSALLSATTLSGHQKKLCGMTRYKKPGPPTPSKNGGRLSFGSKAEPGREILKEIHDDNDGIVKTPARFHLFASRFSMGNSSKNEITEKSENEKSIKNEENSLFTPILNVSDVLRRRSGSQKFNNVIHGSAIQKRLKSSKALCTSTPRKNKNDEIHDRRRFLIEMAQKLSIEKIQATIDLTNNKKEDSMLSELSIIETPPGSKPILTPKVLKLIEQSDQHLKHDSKRKVTQQQHHHQHSGRLSIHKASFTVKKPKCPPLNITNKQQSPHSTQSEMSDDCRRVRRPSLVLRNPNFAPIQWQVSHEKRRRNALKQHQLKKRMERFERFNSRRNLIPRSSTSTGGEESFSIRMGAPKNSTYKLESVRMERKSIIVIGAGESYQSEQLSFACDVNDDDEYEWDDELDYNEETVFGYTYDDDDDDDDDGGHDVSELSKKTHAITNQELHELNQVQSDAKCHKEDKREEKKKIVSSVAKNSSKKEHFEQLLQETASEAPFEVNALQYPETGSTTMVFSKENMWSKPDSGVVTRLRNEASPISLSNSNEVVSSTALIPYKREMNEDISMPSITSSTSVAGSTMVPSMHSSVSTSTSTSASQKSTSSHKNTTSSSLFQSRVIYGPQILYSNRLPNVATTGVRKSSIYLKRKLSDFQSPTSSNVSNAQLSRDQIVLVTNETITIIDLFHMWSHMNKYARFILIFACIGFCLLLFNLFKIIY